MIKKAPGLRTSVPGGLWTVQLLSGSMLQQIVSNLELYSQGYFIPVLHNWT